MSNAGLIEDYVRKFQKAILKAVIDQPNEAMLDELVRQAFAQPADVDGAENFDLLKKIRGRLKVLAVAAQGQPEAGYLDSVVTKLDLAIGSH